VLRVREYRRRRCAPRPPQGIMRIPGLPVTDIREIVRALPERDMQRGTGRNGASRWITGFLVLLGACLAVSFGSALAQAPSRDASVLGATLLPAVGGAEGSQLAVSWSGEADVHLSVSLQRAGGSALPLITDRALDTGVNLVPLALDSNAEGHLALRAV